MLQREAFDQSSDHARNCNGPLRENADGPALSYDALDPIFPVCPEAGSHDDFSSGEVILDLPAVLAVKPINERIIHQVFSADGVKRSQWVIRCAAQHQALPKQGYNGQPNVRPRTLREYARVIPSRHQTRDVFAGFERMQFELDGRNLFQRTEKEWDESSRPHGRRNRDIKNLMFSLRPIVGVLPHALQRN